MFLSLIEQLLQRQILWLINRIHQIDGLLLASKFTKQVVIYLGMWVSADSFMNVGGNWTGIWCVVVLEVFVSMWLTTEF